MGDRPSLCRGILRLNGDFDCDWLNCPVGIDNDHWEHCAFRLPDDDPPAATEAPVPTGAVCAALPSDTEAQDKLWLAGRLREQWCEIERLRGALMIIAGERQCVDTRLSHQDIARIALHGK
jgi:hypothetical protein